MMDLDVSGFMKTSHFDLSRHDLVRIRCNGNHTKMTKDFS